MPRYNTTRRTKPRHGRVPQQGIPASTVLLLLLRHLVLPPRCTLGSFLLLPQPLVVQGQQVVLLLQVTDLMEGHMI